MQYFDWKLKWDLTNVYTDFVNCDIWYQWWIWRKYPDSYTIKKRNWYTTKYDIDWYECTDIIHLDEWSYFLFIKDDRTEVKIYKEDNWSLTELYSWWFEPWLYERFVTFNFVKWEPRKLFTNRDDTISDWWIEVKCAVWDYIKDSSWDEYNTDTDNNWITPSDYLYVYDYTNSTPENDDWVPWQTFIVTDVTSDTITIDWWWMLWDKLEWDDVKYVVLPQWWKVFAFATTDGLIVWHNDNLFLKAWLAPKKIQAMEVHWWVLAILDNEWIFWNWKRWKMILFYDILSQLYVWEYFNMTSFNNYLVLFDTHKIWIITLDDDTKTWYIIPTLYHATNEYWIYDKYAFINYEDNVYIVTNYKRIAAIDITPSWVDKFKITRRFQTYFDWVLENLDIQQVNIKNTDQRLYIFVYDWDKTRIFIYDQYYKLWLQHITQQKILNYDFVSSYFYWWDKIYTYSDTTDDWVDFDQYVHFKFGDESMWTIKSFRLIKLFLWKDTSKNIRLELNNNYAWIKQYKEYKSLGNTAYLTSIVEDQLSLSWIWWNIIWTINVGWLPADTENLLWDLWVIKIDLWLFGEVIEFKLSAEWSERFEMLGFLLWYENLQPHINEVNNVYIVM